MIFLFYAIVGTLIMPFLGLFLLTTAKGSDDQVLGAGLIVGGLVLWIMSGLV